MSRDDQRSSNNRYAELYRQFHWGQKATFMKEIADPRLPNHLIEIGRLVDMKVENPIAHRVHHVHNDDDLDTNHLAFDPDTRNRPLYFILDEKNRRLATSLFRNEKIPWMQLKDLARKVGGRHGRRPYPNVMVQPVGILKAVCYSTIKKGDGPSWYNHDHGENSNVFPWLALGMDGNLWYAGGNYTCPIPGITD